MTLGVSGRFSRPSTTTFSPQMMSPTRSSMLQKLTSTRCCHDEGAQNINISSAETRAAETNPNATNSADRNQRITRSFPDQRGRSGGQIVEDLCGRELARQPGLGFPAIATSDENRPRAAGGGGFQIAQ